MSGFDVYYSIDEFEKVYLPNWRANNQQQKNRFEPQKVGNNLAIELLNLLK